MINVDHPLLKNSSVYVIFLITLGKEMSNNCAPCFNRIDFVAIASYIELP